MVGFIRILRLNIKRMAKRHAGILAILLIGLAISGMALGVYYQLSMQLVTLRDNMSGASNSVEVHGDFYELDAGKLVSAIRALAEEGTSPETSYILAVSYDSERVDILGACANSVPYLMMVGEDYYDKEIPPGNVLIPETLVPEGDENSLPEDTLGKPFRLQGTSYSISAVYSQEMYDASIVDLRRINRSLYDVSGVRMEEPESMMERDLPGVFISMDDFIAAGYTVNSLRVSYAEPISDAQRDAIEAALYSQAIVDPAMMGIDSEESMRAAFESDHATLFAGWADIRKIYSTDYLSRLLLYILAIALSLINVVSLYTAIMEMNKQQNRVLRLCGATEGYLLALLIAELAAYSVVAFTVGLAAGHLFATYSGLIRWISEVSVATYALLLVSLLAAVLLMTLRSMTRSVRRRREDAL